MASSDARRQRRAWKKFVAKNQKALMLQYFKKLNAEESEALKEEYETKS